MLMQSTNQELIDDYLTAVRDATRSLPIGKRETIVGDLESHIEQALPADAGEAEVRTVLDRLGSPESIAAEAGADDVIVSVKKGPSRVKEIVGLDRNQYRLALHPHRRLDRRRCPGVDFPGVVEGPKDGCHPGLARWVVRDVLTTVGKC